MEAFFKNYQYTVNALGVLATSLAVLVSITLAYLGNIKHKPKIKTLMSYGSIIDDKTTRHIIQVSITNVGLLPIYISPSFFRFKNSKTFASMLMPLYRSPHEYPKEIKPGQTEPFIVFEKDKLKETISDYVQSSHFDFYAFLDDGSKFKINLSKELEKDIANIKKSIDK